MIRPILLLPDPILRAKAHKVHGGQKHYAKRVVVDLIDTAVANDGAGLAAPQIGCSLRIAVVKSGDHWITLVNPEITLAVGAEMGLEGCLSLPAFIRSQVIRATRINYRSASGTAQATGMLARVIQHEVDHLYGILIIDKEVQDADAEKEEVGPVAGVL